MGAFAAFSIVMFVIYFAILALYFVSFWIMFTKMGHPGWKGIIPMYNIFVMIKSLRKPKNWIWVFISTLIICLFYLAVLASSMITGSGGIMVFVANILLLISVVACVVYEIKLYCALSIAFGYSKWYTVGLILVPIVFFAIIAFDDNQFLLPRATCD